MIWDFVGVDRRGVDDAFDVVVDDRVEYSVLAVGVVIDQALVGAC